MGTHFFHASNLNWSTLLSTVLVGAGFERNMMREGFGMWELLLKTMAKEPMSAGCRN